MGAESSSGEDEGEEDGEDEEEEEDRPTFERSSAPVGPGRYSGLPGLGSKPGASIFDRLALGQVAEGLQGTADGPKRKKKLKKKKKKKDERTSPNHLQSASPSRSRTPSVPGSPLRRSYDVSLLSHNRDMALARTSLPGPSPGMAVARTSLSGFALMSAGRRRNSVGGEGEGAAGSNLPRYMQQTVTSRAYIGEWHA